MYKKNESGTTMYKYSICILTLCLLPTVSLANCQEARSIFVPRQLSYNPILEQALTLNDRVNSDADYLLSIKPIYTQSVGSTLNSYFLPCHKPCLSIREDGSGDVSSVWFSVIAPSGSFYDSTLSFHPKRQTYGALFYAALQCSCNFNVSITTALVQARNRMNICETGVTALGICPCSETVTESFGNCSRCFGRATCKSHQKTGLDDIQIKGAYTFCNNDTAYVDSYLLVGIPTGKGSKAVYLFEPLVGSKHAQLGFGTTGVWNIQQDECQRWSLQGEFKYRYGFAGKECRSFDLTKNCQWSRYMLFVPKSDPYSFYPAINTLTFHAKVTPRSSVDLYGALHYAYSAWNFELGYNLWYRSAEKISLCNSSLPAVGIADLTGIAAQNPFTASTANISQGVLPGNNQMVSDTSFVPVTFSDISCQSGAAAASLSNSVYGSIAYSCDTRLCGMQVGVNVSYEQGSLHHTPNNITTWLTWDILF